LIPIIAPIAEPAISTAVYSITETLTTFTVSPTYELCDIDRNQWRIYRYLKGE